MAAVIRLVNGTQNDLEDLSSWLSDEDELRGGVSPQAPAMGPNEMGGLADALVIAVGSGGALTVLARSLQTWFELHRSSIDLSISDSSTGKHVQVNATNIRDAEILLTRLLDAE